MPIFGAGSHFLLFQLRFKIMSQVYLAQRSNWEWTGSSNSVLIQEINLKAQSIPD